MKHLLFSLCIVFACVLTSNHAKAQSHEFSLGGEIVVPTGDFSDVSNIGPGLTFRFENPLGKKMSWMVTTSFLYASGKNIGGIKAPAITLVPVQTGFKYYFEEQMKGFYASAEVGFHYLASSHESGTVNGFSYDIPSQNETDLSYAPGLGFHTTGADVSFRYNIISPSSGPNITYFGIHIAAILNRK